MKPTWMRVEFDGCGGTPPSGVITLGRLEGIPLAVLVGPVAEAVLRVDDCVTMDDGSH